MTASCVAPSKRKSPALILDTLPVIVPLTANSGGKHPVSRANIDLYLPHSLRIPAAAIGCLLAPSSLMTMSPSVKVSRSFCRMRSISLSIAPFGSPMRFGSLVGQTNGSPSFCLLLMLTQQSSTLHSSAPTLPTVLSLSSDARLWVC